MISRKMDLQILLEAIETVEVKEIEKISESEENELVCCEENPVNLVFQD
jgi:hypothetical protein